MYLLLIFLFLKSGQVEARTSIVYGYLATNNSAENACEIAKPLSIRLYQQGRFDDGPKKGDLKKVTGECIEVLENEKFSER